jgi:hypothetical protein
MSDGGDLVRKQFGAHDHSTPMLQVHLLKSTKG